MKKAIAILLVFALAFTIAACGESAVASGTGEAETTDAIGYIPNREGFEINCYEANNGKFMPGMGENTG